MIHEISRATVNFELYLRGMHSRRGSVCHGAFLASGELAQALPASSRECCGAVRYVVK